MRALERDRSARWPSAEDMLAALQRYLYSLEETPGPRDVAALVARYCPPETRRLPTHADTPGDEPAPAGPRTAVIEREGAQPRGKQRARTETFATHVDLKNLLERATPLFPIQAITDEPRTDDTPPRPSRRMHAVRDDATPARSQRMASVREPIGRRTPSRAGIVLAAVGTLGLGGAALYVFSKGKGSVLRADAMPKYDAPHYAFEPEAGPGDLPYVHDAAELDAAVDAPPIDAAPRPPRDAAPDAAAAIAGTGMLKIGAKPWAEIYVNGTRRGRTPQELEVAVGKYTVELVYSGETPPVKKAFSVGVTAGKTEPVFHDFTSP
jgi:hypothetical protein